MRFRFSLLGLLGLTTLCGLAAGALVQPSSLWLSLIVSLTALAIIVQTVRVLLETGTARAAAVGWLLFAVSYLAIALGPWLSANLGGQLATSRGIDFAIARTEQVVDLDYYRGGGYQIPQSNVNGVDNPNTTWIDINYQIVSANQLATNVAAVPGLEHRQLFTQSAHWLAAWVAGWLGAAIAVQLASRRAKPAVYGSRVGQ
ncbi:MAG: hypothetical protein MUF06_05085 [Pirellulaceae bacterium]|jgi:hypothetical protein|nr:hypothetical protein [Pirellulaceae bacterium]